MRSVANKLKLNGAISRKAAKRPPALRRGRQSLSHHNSKARTAICKTRWATKLHTPHPANANSTAATPLTNEAVKVTLDKRANRKRRVKMVCWMTHSALTGTNRKKTGAICVMTGMS